MTHTEKSKSQPIGGWTAWRSSAVALTRPVAKNAHHQDKSHAG